MGKPQSMASCLSSGVFWSLLDQPHNLASLLLTWGPHVKPSGINVGRWPEVQMIDSLWFYFDVDLVGFFFVVVVCLFFNFFLSGPGSRGL